MKPFMILLLILVVATAAAQPGPQPCKETFFSSGELSSRICQPVGGESGEAVVFSREGKEIYRRDIQHQEVKSQIRFTYYADGGVKLAKSTWHAGSGNESWSMVTEFDQEGKMVGEQKMKSPPNLEMEGLKNPAIPGQGPDLTMKIGTEPKRFPPTSESLVFLVNHTHHALTYRFATLDEPHVECMMRPEVTVQPGDTVNFGYLIQQGDFPDPCKLLEMTVSAKRKCWLKRVRQECGFREEDMPNPAVRHYYFTSQRR